MNRFIVLFFVIGRIVSGAELSAVSTSGEKQANVLFRLSGALSQTPQMKITDNVIELSFAGAELSDKFQGKLDIDSPHVLIKRMSFYSAEKKVVKGKIVVNGSIEGLRQRLSLSPVPEGLKLTLDYPAGDNATLNLLRDEQLPILENTGKQKLAAAGGSRWQIGFLLGFLCVAGAVTFFITRFLKKKGGMQGSRKYLIEQLSYCPLGGKGGVALIKVGHEFVLVGITQNQVNLLSTLPKLQEQYESETQFDRTVFQEAVQEELYKSRRQKGIST